MKRILNFKHWQLFLLIVIPGAWTSPSPLKEIVNSIAVITFLIWIYSIGTSGYDKLRDRGIGPSNIGLFKINILLIPILILLVYLLDTGTEDFESIDIITVPVTLYLLFAFAQTIMFSAKTLKAIEINKTPEFGDWFSNFILTLLFFIGIWIIQPKVNKYLVESD